MRTTSPEPTTGAGRQAGAGTRAGSAEPDGAVSNGSVADGAVPDGDVPEGAVPDGAVPEMASRLLLAERRRWEVEARWSAADAVLLVVRAPRRSVVSIGSPTGARDLLAAVAEEIGPVASMTLPRLGPGPEGVHGGDGHGLGRDEDLAPALRGLLGVEAATAWDRLVLAAPPAPARAGAGHAVTRLDLAADLDAIRACLGAANPGSSADPGAADEAAWFGVPAAGGLAGVVGAGLRAGDPEGADLSWHLHGLGVLPDARERGLGRALTATAARAAFDAGADWVSLGMFADNHTARRLYERLGFEVEGRFTSYRPAA